MTASHSSSVMFTSIRSRRMPALLTSTSSPPKVSIACLTRRSAPSQSEMSSPLATASPPAATISSTTSLGRAARRARCRPCSPPRSLTTTLAPSRGQHQRVLAADAPAGAGDDAHSSFAHVSHAPSLPSEAGSGRPVPICRAGTGRRLLTWAGMSPFRDRISTQAELREHYRQSSETTRRKRIDHLDGHCRAFVAHATFVLVGTAAADGTADVSPKGGPPGFVVVLDDHRLDESPTSRETTCSTPSRTCCTTTASACSS